jgi:hypothetical protein
MDRPVVPFAFAPDASRPLLWIGAAGLRDEIAAELAMLLGMDGAPVHAVRLPQLVPDLIDRLAPRAAVSLLSWPGGDALEAAIRLARAGYAGPYRILSPALPDRRLVEREIGAEAPGVQVKVIELEAASRSLRTR